MEDIKNDFTKYEITQAMVLLKNYKEDIVTPSKEIREINQNIKNCMNLTKQVMDNILKDQVIEYTGDKNINGNTIEKIEKMEKENREKELTKYIEELNSLVGLEKVKKDVNNLINLVRVKKMRKEMGLLTTDVSLHLVFTGNPGTGKTTVARLIGKLYKSIGILPSGHLVEVDRSGLIGQYIGHTEHKTIKVIESAIGGILFIDEAYALAGKGEKDYGNDAIEVLLKQMEDRRDEFVIIVAGYSNKMNEFLNSNPGLKSRFNKFFDFEDYSSENLSQILIKMCKDSEYALSDDALEHVNNIMEKLSNEKDEHFANGRSVRNLFEKVVANQANRIIKIENPSKEDLMNLDISDFNI